MITQLFSWYCPSLSFFHKFTSRCDSCIMLVHLRVDFPFVTVVYEYKIMYAVVGFIVFVLGPVLSEGKRRQKKISDN